MLLLGSMSLNTNIYSEATFDLILLALLSTPLIYILVIKPFVIARDEALDHINHLAHTDPLTLLPNRRLLLLHLEKCLAGAVRHKAHGAILLMDLDGFKDINDIYGHHAGDKVLIETAKRILAHTRAEDVTGRLGGDEFILSIQHLDTDDQIARDTARSVAEKLVNAIGKPIDFNGEQLNVSASIGIRFLGLEETDTKTVLRDADTAMYQAKKMGRGCAIFFEK